MHPTEAPQLDQQALIRLIRKAFAHRERPESQALIDPHFDAATNTEAAAVQQVVREIKNRSVGESREPVVYDALIYLSSDAMAFYLPIVLVSLVERFDDGEHLFASIYYALCKEPIVPGVTRRFSLSTIFNDAVRRAVCGFINWVPAQTAQQNMAEEYMELKAIWCSRDH